MAQHMRYSICLNKRPISQWKLLPTLCLLQAKFYEDPLTIGELTKAVKTMDPNNFYSTSKKCKEKQEAQNLLQVRRIWMAKLLQPTFPQIFQQYVRVVVSGKGFKPETEEFVRKYNFSKEGKMQPIVLLDLQAKLIGENLYKLLKGTAGKKTKVISSTKASTRALHILLPTNIPPELEQVSAPEEPVSAIITRPESSLLTAAKNPTKEELEQAQADPLSECEEEITN